MKNKKFTMALTVAMISTLLLNACGSSGTGGSGSSRGSVDPGSDGDVYTFKIANVVAETNPTAVAMQYFADKLEEESEGRIKVEIYGNGEFGGSESEQIQMAMDGTIQFTAVPGGQIAVLADSLKGFNIGDYPYLYDDYESAYELWDSDVFDTLGETLNSSVGLNLLGVYNVGWNVLSANKEITLPEDIKNLKMRVNVNEMYISTLEKWGCTPATIAFNEAYTALQQGAADGMQSSLNIYSQQGFYEVQDYLATTNHSMISHYAIMNAEWYNSLPDDLKEVFDQCASDYIEEARKIHQEAEVESIEILRDNGMTVNELTDDQRAVWAEAVTGVTEEYADVAGKDFLNEALEVLGKDAV